MLKNIIKQTREKVLKWGFFITATGAISAMAVALNKYYEFEQLEMKVIQMTIEEQKLIWRIEQLESARRADRIIQSSRHDHLSEQIIRLKLELEAKHGNR